MTQPTISDAIDGGAYLDVDGEVMTIHQPHLTSDDPGARRETVVLVWPSPGMPESRVRLHLEGTASEEEIIAALREDGAINITPVWQD